jgi:hypothetical protein
MNDNYIKQRVDKILRDKIASGGEAKHHRYKNASCTIPRIKKGRAPYWKKYNKNGTTECVNYPSYLENKAQVYRERQLGKLGPVRYNKHFGGPSVPEDVLEELELPEEVYASGCMNCPCAAGVLINSARYGGYGNKAGAAKNPWIQCIKKRAQLYNEGKGCGYGGIESHMEYVNAAAKNPWLQFLREFRMEHPEYQHLPQNELVKIARQYYTPERMRRR